MYRQWGIPLEAIDELDERLAGFFRLYARTMRARTRDSSGYGLAYLSGILQMETGRTLVGISRASGVDGQGDRKSTRLNSSHTVISYAVFCLKKKKKTQTSCAYMI